MHTSLLIYLNVFNWQEILAWNVLSFKRWNLMRLLRIKLATFREGYVPFYFDAFAEFLQRYSLGFWREIWIWSKDWQCIMILVLIEFLGWIFLLNIESVYILLFIKGLSDLKYSQYVKIRVPLWFFFHCI